MRFISMSIFTKYIVESNKYFSYISALIGLFNNNNISINLYVYLLPKSWF